MARCISGCVSWFTRRGVPVAAAGLVAVSPSPASAGAAPATSPPETTFPLVRGSNLEGRKFALPADFEGETNLVLVAFQRWHQDLVDTWVPVARELKKADPRFTYYELPTIYRGNPLFRFWLDNAMAGGIPDVAARRATITLYLDKPEFRRALAIPDEKTIHLYLVDRDGRIHWQAEGALTKQTEQSLRTALKKRLPPPANKTP